MDLGEVLDAAAGLLAEAPAVVAAGEVVAHPRFLGLHLAVAAGDEFVVAAAIVGAGLQQGDEFGLAGRLASQDVVEESHVLRAVGVGIGDGSHAEAPDERGDPLLIAAGDADRVQFDRVRPKSIQVHVHRLAIAEGVGQDVDPCPQDRLGGLHEPPRAFRFTTSGDRFGWYQGENGHWQLTLRIPAGRVADREGAPWRTGLREIASVHRGHFRVTPNQNLVIADIPVGERATIEALVRQHALDLHERATPLHRDALACVAMPTCPLAMAEAERYLPSFVGHVDALLARNGLPREPLLVRITGCPNGCARPQLAEVALIGKAPGRYNLYLGGDSIGQRLNRLHRENLDEPSILAELDLLFARWARERRAQERFGDYVNRLWPEGPIAPDLARSPA